MLGLVVRRCAGLGPAVQMVLMAHPEAAVDWDDCAGDVSASIAGEEVNGCRDILWAADPTQRDAVDDVVVESPTAQPSCRCQ